MRNAYLALFLGLLLAATARADDVQQNPTPSSPPTFFPSIEVLAIGPAQIRSMSDTWQRSSVISVASVTARWHALRLGASVLELSDEGIQFLPLAVGATIWSRQEPMWGRFYAFAPEVYAQLSGCVLDVVSFDPPPSTDFVGRAELIAAADVYGVGVKVFAGPCFRRGNDMSGAKYNALTFRAAVQVRLGVFNLGS
jgi:hypothetical protein